MSETRSFSDVYIDLFLYAAKKDRIMRGVVKNKATGQMYECVAIDDGRDGVAPVFLVPIGGSKAIIDNYEVIKEDGANVNPIPAEFQKMLGGSASVH